MPPHSLAEPHEPSMTAPFDQVFMLRCNWDTAEISVVSVPKVDVSCEEFLEDDEGMMGLCRLPDAISWNSVDRLVREFVLPIAQRVRDGYRETSGGTAFTLEAGAAKDLVALLVAAWRVGAEQ